MALSRREVWGEGSGMISGGWGELRLVDFPMPEVL
jgi:hypothetical protein